MSQIDYLHSLVNRKVCTEKAQEDHRVRGRRAVVAAFRFFCAADGFRSQVPVPLTQDHEEVFEEMQKAVKHFKEASAYERVSMGSLTRQYDFGVRAKARLFS